MIKPATPATLQTPPQRVLALVEQTLLCLQRFVVEPSEGFDVKSVSLSKAEYPLEHYDFTLVVNCGWEFYQIAWQIPEIVADYFKLQVRFVKLYLDQPGAQTEDFAYEYVLRSDATLGREDDAIFQKACSDFLLKHIVPKYAVAVAQT